MAFEIKMPTVGLMMETGLVAAWYKNEGDKVEKGEVIAEMETEKMSSPIEAAGSGVLLKIIAPVGTELPPGGFMGYIGEPGEEIAVSVVQDEAQKGAVDLQQDRQMESVNFIRISPLAKKIAKENNLDYSRVTGSGPMGRIVAKDIRETVANRKTCVVPVTMPMPGIEDSYLPYGGIRKSIGENMLNSWLTAPRVTHFASVDSTEMKRVRNQFNLGVENHDKASVIGFLVKIVARAIEGYPVVNASLEGTQIHRHGAINIGVAVAVERGLLVPVVKNANKKSLLEISREIRDLSGRAKNNQLAPEEMQGGTFTVSSLGAYDSVEYFTPIINQPESAILGIGRMMDTPVAINGEVVIRPMLPLSLVFDHRVIDGAPAAEFLRLIMDVIENPMKFLL